MHCLETCHIVTHFPGCTSDFLGISPTIYTVGVVWKDVLIFEGF